MTRAIIKHITASVYQPLLIKHLSTTRKYAYKGIHLEIPAGIFHPKYFFSTKLLLQYITRLSVKGKSFLELGAGSGLISLWAAREGALVSATDINPLAVDSLKKNRLFNHLDLTIILSDMFEKIPPQQFDIIAINPPYYQKNPVSYADYAWYCGENGEYFKALFDGLKNYIHSGTTVCMVLCDGCNQNMISSLADQYGWKMNYVIKKKNLLENNFIISIEPIGSSGSQTVLPVKGNKPFDDIYIRLRKAEHRIYADEEVKQLPHVSRSHPYYKEWVIREKSAKKLFYYLLKKRKLVKILDVGCGNGWLSSLLAKLPETKVTGIEANTLEFQQAQRVFAQQANLQFIQGDFNEMDFKSFGPFDIIVMAASIQYFPSAEKVLKNMIIHFLKPGGEIHIIDSPLYKDEDVTAAVTRTKEYYMHVGFPEMIPYYFHHTFSELQTFHYCFLNNHIMKHFPLLRKYHSFYWIRIKNE